MTTVLVHEWVTGGGLAGSDLPRSWAAEGGAMRRAIAGDLASLPGARVVMTLDARLPDEPGPWTVVRVGPGDEAATLARLAAGADWTAVIAPETAGTLADRTRWVERAGGRSLGSTPEAIALAGDKLRTGAYLRERGIPTPECRAVVPGDGLPGDLAYPAVLKPIDGAGSVATFWIPDAAAIPDGVDRSSPALLQPYVPGTPMSASLLVGPGGRADLVAIGLQRMKVQGGRFVYLGGTIPAPRDVPADVPRLAVESIAGLRGFVGVDFVRDDATGRLTVLEINPRPTTSIVGLSRILPPGALARAWIDAVEGGSRDGAEGLAEVVRAGGRVTFRADGADGP